MNPLADSHVHLDDARFDEDRETVIARARAAGVHTQIVPGTDITSWPRIQALSAAHDDVFAAYGLHPMFVERHQPGDLVALPGWLIQKETVAVGEIGLDFYEGEQHAAKQREYFQQQLNLAKEHDLPVILHARRALEEVTTTLRRTGGLRGVVHSFSGSEEQAEQLWKLGFHLGIGGPITYARAQRLRRIVATMPLEYLLLESDAPDQPDATHRGQRNEPAFVAQVLACVAGLRGVDASEVAAATTANVRKLFRLVS